MRTLSMIRRRSTLELTLVLLASLLVAGPIRARDDLSRSLRVSPDGHYLTEPDGEPFFWQADTAWSLISRLTREEAELYLRDRAAKGFNIIQAVAAPAPGETLETPNRYGQQPFVDRDPRRPNELYFQHLDWVIERAGSYGIRVALLPTWGVSEISMRRDVFDPVSAEAYGRWLGSRYRGKGLVWVLGGDTSPIFPAASPGVDSVAGRPMYRRPISVVDDRPIYDAFAKGIEAGAGSDAFITFHPGSFHFSGTAPMRTSLYFHDRAWLDMNMLQSGHYADARVSGENWLQVEGVWVGPRNYEIVAAEYASEPVRPVIDGEARFEDLPIGVKKDASLGYWTGYDARNAAYHAVFAGAAGHTYGNHAVWQFQGAPAKTFEAPAPGLDWQQALMRPAAAQMQHLKKLILSRPYFSRIPDQALIVGDPGQGAAHVGATRDKEGRYAFIYLPFGQPVTVDLTRLTGRRFTAWWFDPRTGEAQRMLPAFQRTPTRSFTPPTHGPQVDWVLVLDDDEQGYLAPGAAGTEHADDTVIRAAEPSPPARPALLVILIDGARWDFIDPRTTPHLDKLAKAGARGEMIPVWPTISRPNHWALAAGLYPIRSGIFHNSMFDPASGELVDWSEETSAHGEPIWATAARQGLTSGVIGGWAGARISAGAKRPSFHVPYSVAHLPNAAPIGGRDNRASLVLGLLDQDPSVRPDILALYVIEVDHAQHRYGVGSAEARKTASQIDSMIGELIAGLASRQLNDQVNILIVSDHGQMNIGRGQSIVLEDFVDLAQLRTPPVGGGPVFSLWPEPGAEDAVADRLRTAHPHLHVFRPGEIPEQWRCCHPDRMPPILVATDPGWTLSLRSDRPLDGRGTHGYDNAVRDMHALFVASGPDIHAGTNVEPFSNVDVYPLMSQLLGIEPANTDGSIRSLCAVLRNSPAECRRAQQ